MRLRPISELLLAVLLAMAAPVINLNAQTTTSGGLTGVVNDPSHAVAPDAGIKIKDDAKGTIQSTKTGGCPLITEMSGPRNRQVQPRKLR